MLCFTVTFVHIAVVSYTRLFGYQGTSATSACYLMLTAKMSSGTEMAEHSFFPSAATALCRGRSAPFAACAR